MNAPPKVGFLGRTFGWSGSRSEWLLLAGILAWLATGYGIHLVAQRLTLGESILLYALWLLAFGAVARDAIRNLFGPVFFHDVVRTGRMRLTFSLRWLYALLVSFVLTMLYYMWLSGKGYFSNPNFVVGTNELSQFGTEFFHTFIILQFLIVVLLTPVYVAGTICVDKERKILEFLFATDLLNREIIFGKLASRVLTLLMFILLGLPILAFVQLFGGVDPEQLLATTVATIVTVFGLSALGIWFSTMMKKARDAIMLTYLSYGAYMAASFFGAAFSTFGGPGWWNTPLPLGRFSFGLHEVFQTLAEGNVVWQLLITNAPRATTRFTLDQQLSGYCLFWLIASGLLLGHAILRLRAIALRQAYGAPGGTRSRKRKVVTNVGSEQVVVNELTRRYPPVGENPVLWKEVFVDAGLRGGWMAKVLFGLIALLMIAPIMVIVWNELIDPFYRAFSFAERWHRFRESANAWVRVVTGILTLLILLSATVRGAGAISGEKDKDSWISLLGTPLSADEILSGKFWGCVLGQRRIYFFLLFIWTIALALGAANVFMILLDLVLIFLYVCAFSWIGLFCSMTARTTMIATVRAFFAAIFCAGGFWAVLFLCCALPLMFSGMRVDNDFEAVLQLLLGLTPPFLTGWLPMFEFERNDLDPFRPDGNGIGLAAPVLSTLAWACFTVFLMVICKLKFRQVTNREQPERVASEPATNASKKGRYE